MPESKEFEASTRVAKVEETDPATRWLGWGVVAVLLLVVAVFVYAFLTGVFGNNSVARTAEDNALMTTAAAIQKNPTDGGPYAIRAEALARIGSWNQAYAALDQGEKAVGTAEPALMIILRSRVQLLNMQRRYAEAVPYGLRAMKASDEYLFNQGKALAERGIAVNENLQTAVSEDTAFQVASSYMGLRKWDQAAALYTYALRFNPMASDVISARGWAYLNSGQKEKAKADFKQALKFVPDDSDALQGLKALASATATSSATTSTAK